MHEKPGRCALPQAEGRGAIQQPPASCADSRHHAGHRHPGAKGGPGNIRQLPALHLHIIRLDDYRARMPSSRLALGTVQHAVRIPQEMLAGLCESYGSVISLAVYVGVLAGDEDAETRIASSVAAVKSEFDRYPCHRQANPAAEAFT
jgi:hypothetical protein